MSEDQNNAGEFSSNNEVDGSFDAIFDDPPQDDNSANPEEPKDIQYSDQAITYKSNPLSSRTRRMTNLDVYNSYDHSIHRSITQKRLSMSFLAAPVLKEDPGKKYIYDHFLILGCPVANDLENYENCTRESPTPQLLFVYPSAPLIFSPQEFKTLVRFCFPTGLAPGCKTNHSIFRNQFVFRLTEDSDGAVVYGICTHINVTPFHKLFFADEFSKQYEFCFCFLTKIPMFSVLFQYSIFLGLWTYQNLKYVAHPDAFIHFTPPTESDTTTILPGLQFAAGSQRAKSFRIPRPFLQELAWFHSLRSLKGVEQRINISLKLHLTIPRILNNERYILYPCLDSLFSFLSVRNIVELYTNLLLEVQTVFVSSNLHALTLSILAIVTLLEPFAPNGTVMPVLPRDPQFSTFLESPVPYIVGKLIKPDEEFIAPAHICVVDLDNDQVIVQDPIPDLPCQEELKKSLRTIISQYEAKITVPQKIVKLGVLKKGTKLNEKYINFIRTIGDFNCPRAIINMEYQKYVFTPEVCDKIIAAFAESVAPTVESLIKPCFVTETTDIDHPVTVFNKELFIDSVPPKAHTFYAAFTTTTIFQEFVDAQTDRAAQEIANETHSVKPKKRVKGLKPA